MRPSGGRTCLASHQTLPSGSWALLRVYLGFNDAVLWIVFSVDLGDRTLMLKFLVRISGTAYDEAATRDARERIVDFFNRYLKEDDATSR